MKTVFGVYEVESCINIGSDYIETCEEKDAEFFSVYHRNNEGYADCLKDFSSRKKAENYAIEEHDECKSIVIVMPESTEYDCHDFT